MDGEKPAGRIGPWSSLGYFILKMLPGAWNKEVGERRSPTRYLRLWRFTVIITAGVTLTPLVATTAFDYYHFRETFKDEMIRPVRRTTSATKQSMEFFLTERRSALSFIIQNNSFEDLSREEKLASILRNMKGTFGGFIDLGLIDSTGTQRSYVGPFDLTGKNYQDQAWFHEVWLRGVYVSDVFMGHRNFPHFVIAVKYEKDDADFFVLRATIDSEKLYRQIFSHGLKPGSDIFIINRKSVLQSPSRLFGDVLNTLPFDSPGYSKTPEILEEYEIEGSAYIFGYAFIEHSPFILIVLQEPHNLMQNWMMLRMGFLGASVVLIILLVTGTSAYLVARIRDADQRQARALHSVQYTSKMASIGRLAAGVAHEVNNPLAIINEKAGLAKDILSLSDDFPKKEKIEGLVESILSSVERCSTITHRLLGFAKRIDTRTETIDLELLINEVLSFMEKEVSYRNISVKTNVADSIPSIMSDRGQLQQVFLNIINNAIEELEHGGDITISIESKDDGMVAVTISDNGGGIAKENLKQIFDPFYTTKKEYGTGLGLSITFGIVEKLGGKISVKSEIGKGTSFTVALPVGQSPI